MVTVEFTTTTDGTATQGADFVPQNGMLTFDDPDVLTKQITVLTVEDGATELDETVEVLLFNPNNATFSDETGVGTIENDDAPMVSMVGDVSEDEEAGMIEFYAEIPDPISSDITFDYSTSNGTATSGSDYIAVNPTQVTIPAFATTSNVMQVLILADNDAEDDETFTVTISNLTSGNATIDPTGNTATGTIENNDLPLVSVTDASFDEGDGVVTFTLTIDHYLGTQLDVDWTTENDDDGPFPATDSGVDYSDDSDTESFTSAASIDVDIVVNVDGFDEMNETFLFTITENGTSPQDYKFDENDTLSSITVTGTILNDTGGPQVSVVDWESRERHSGTHTVDFDVHLTEYPGADVLIDYTIADGSANESVGDDDYDFPVGGAAGTLTFTDLGPETVTITINGDLEDLGDVDETLTCTLVFNAGGAAATVLNGVGTGTILDDDDPFAFDCNGDGFDDLVYGAPYEENSGGGSTDGAVYVFLGDGTAPPASRDNSDADVTITGVANEGTFGLNTIPLGDFNNDGYDDFGVSADDYDLAGNNTGSFYVFFGAESGSDMFPNDPGDGQVVFNVATDMTDIPHVRFDGTVGGGFLGKSAAGLRPHYGNAGGVDGLQTFNNDEIIDLAIGRDGGTGRVYVFFGDPNVYPGAGQRIRRS